MKFVICNAKRSSLASRGDIVRVIAKVVVCSVCFAGRSRLYAKSLLVNAPVVSEQTGSDYYDWHPHVRYDLALANFLAYPKG